MPGRVLTFGEFSNKYSDGNSEPASVEDIANAASNFEEGFDEETYDQPEIKPNRPVSGNYEMTPAGPGEEGAPNFSADNTEEMNAPQEEESEESEEEEKEESEESEEEKEESEEIEEGNPEAGANPKEKVEEGFTLVKGFTQFINEDHGDYPSFYDEDDEYFEECPECGGEGCRSCNYEGHIPLRDTGEYAHNYGEGDECPECGEVPLSNEYGMSCGCNM
jgi:type IV secretory pathway VirB10-like protein